MATDQQTISLRAYAETLNISDKAVRNAIRDKKIVDGVLYEEKLIKGQPTRVPKILPTVADAEWGHLHKVVKPRAGQSKDKMIEKLESATDHSSESVKNEKKDTDDSDDDLTDEEAINIKVHGNLSYREASRRREIVSLAMDRMKLRELEGSLIKKTTVEKTLFSFGVELKKSLLNLPARITAEVRNAETEVEAQTIITKSITEILENFSGMEELKI